ncbi:hypothetical protein [Neomegalonema sp.]|uniref:hypothetical protein n=1 Tax=Neomegalonema sp. TaxID=2039713 RepID=UPI00261BBF1E|nr:hypothetical protein [Neomegalonema sp.]MDD2868077.1 hypothetical protein [Neomegalonema sp.]
MSGGTVYQRAAKRHAVLIEHLVGEATEGFLLVPIGVALEQYIHQIEHIFPLEAMDGRRLYISLGGVKFIAPREDEGAAPMSAPAPSRETRVEPPRPAAASRPPDENSAAARELVERQRRERQKRVADERRRRREEDPDAAAAARRIPTPPPPSTC